MIYRVGVVGPHSSVDRILDAAKDFSKGLQFIPYPYEDTSHTAEIVEQNDHKVDAWLFSGKIPYMIAQKTLGFNDNLIFVPHTESSLYKCFLKMAYYQGKMLDRISIDTVTSESVTEAIQELGIPQREIYVKNYEDYVDPNELFQFHLDLWKAGKTEGALTCFRATYARLQKAGIPAYWISPTRMVIRQTLDIVVEKVKTSYFKGTQIGVEIIEIDNFDKVIAKTKTPYQIQYIELRLKERMLNLCEKLDATLLEKGNGRYVIFSSRGAIEREIKSLQNTVEEMKKLVDMNVSIGIGFGETVYAAEINARTALQHSKEKVVNGIVIVQEDGAIVESVGTMEELSYSSRTTDEEFMQKFKVTNVSVRTFKKIEALIYKMGWNRFTPSDLAEHLGMTDRNARGILSKLCKFDLAECIGEESAANRGRPSKLYRLK